MRYVFLLVICCLMAPVAAVAASDCDFTGDTAKGVQKCFGASGPHCEGEPLHWTEKNEQSCYVKAWISVGSILHDNCCLKHSDGKYCDGADKGAWDDVTFKDDSKPCSREWRKATYNSRDGRGWWEYFGPYKKDGKGDDLGTKPTRLAVTTDHFGGSKQKYGGTETVKSRSLVAPAGTSLDYTDDTAFCKSGKFAVYEDWFNWGKKTDRHYLAGVSEWGVCQ